MTTYASLTRKMVHFGGQEYYPEVVPKRATSDSAGLDLSTPYPFTLPKGEGVLVDSGLIIQAPLYHCILILPRSGLACKHGITIPNSPGLIDRDYCGPDDTIKVKLVNNGPTNFSFQKGDRIAQMLFVKYENIWLAETNPELNPNKNRGGFGSTGL